MKKHIKYSLIGILLFILGACSSSNDYLLEYPSAPEFMRIGDRTLVVNKLTEKDLGNGMKYFNYNTIIDDYRNNHYLNIHLTTLDMTTSNYKPNILLAGEKLNERKTPMEIASYHSEKKKTPVVINGDYFHTGGDFVGLQMGIQILDGRLYKTGRGLVYGFDWDYKPFISRLTVEAKANQMIINDVNELRYADYLILYTPDFGPSTGTNPWGTEVVLKAKDNELDWQNTKDYKDLVYVVTQKVNGGNSPLPKGALVLSGHGTAATALQAYNEGDEIILNIAITDSETGKGVAVKSTIGGSHHILVKGKQADFLPSGNAIEDDLVKELHPRSAIGHSVDGKIIYLVVVEGRLPQRSEGVSLPELADILKFLGVEEGFNLDGGGSSCLSVNNERINWLPDQKTETDETVFVRIVPNVIGFSLDN